MTKKKNNFKKREFNYIHRYAAHVFQLDGYVI